ncbi:MAG: hypothetical protein ACRD0X_03515 [Thermoanaerobaculia bacterium]
MPEGVIAGGWSFVAAAYGVTVLGLGAYLWSLWRRSARAENPND